MPDQKLDEALSLKKEGNDLFKTNNFEGAILKYNEAIKTCPPHRMSELSIMYQNRAAANERLEKLELALQDCDLSIQNNNRYGKALDRQAKVLRKLAAKLGGDEENLNKRILMLTQALEDMSMCCQLEGYKQEQLTFIDGLLKELGSAEAILANKTRVPDLPSGHTINQYFTSFTQDPFMKPVEGDSPYSKALEYYKKDEFERIIPCCDEEIQGNLAHKLEAKLTKATFLILQRQHSEAMHLLSEIIDDSECATNIKANALIKRGALHIQRCIDPTKDAELSLADFNEAEKLMPDCADVYMNRGQVRLLLDMFNDAVTDLNKANTLNPDFALAYVQKLYTDFLSAQASTDQNKLKASVDGFQDAIEKFPECVEAYALYAKVLQEQFKLSEAEEMYKKGAELNPKNANLIIHRALLNLQMTGNIEECLGKINQAIKMDEKNEFGFETLGQLELQRENYENAANHFDKVKSVGRKSDGTIGL
jgi:import receptor subunit TOM70